MKRLGLHTLITGTITGILALIFPEYWITAVIIFGFAIAIELISMLLDWLFFDKT